MPRAEKKTTLKGAKEALAAQAMPKSPNPKQAVKTRKTAQPAVLESNVVSKEEPSLKKMSAVDTKPQALTKENADVAVVPTKEKPIQSSSKKSPHNQKFMRKALAGAGLSICLIAAGFWYWQYRTTTVVEAKAADQRLIAEVGKRAALPAGETPAVSTIVDETKINQEFLRGTQKGDKVLLYFRAERAFVYRPSTGQIINTGPLEAPKPQVFMRGGAPDADMSKVAATVSGTGEFEIASQDRSPKKAYQKTIVVDVAGNRPDIARKLAGLLNATVASMPDGESRPDADMLIIVGRDFDKR